MGNDDIRYSIIILYISHPLKKEFSKSYSVAKRGSPFEISSKSCCRKGSAAPVLVKE